MSKLPIYKSLFIFIEGGLTHTPRWIYYLSILLYFFFWINIYTPTLSEKYFNKWEEEAKIGCVWNKIHRCSIQIYVCNLLNFTYYRYIPFCLLVFFVVVEGLEEKPEILLKINHFYPIKNSVTKLFKSFSHILKLIYNFS